MARTYTVRSILDGQTVKADDLNYEHVEALRQINGNLDAHSVPLRSITSGKLVAPTLDRTTYASTVSSYGAANSYHRSVKQATSLTIPNVTIDPGTDDFEGGWRSIWPLQAFSDEAGSLLEFASREGMLRGQYQIDVERRLSYASRTEGASTTYPSTHVNDWLQFAVFVNDIQVADSGKIYSKRYTLDLPWACPAPAGECRVEAKFRANTQYLIPASTVGGVTWSYPSPAERYPDLKLYGGYLWCRNQYR